jgi:hypothetical protein|tara:strand:+ start:866 stop:1156 length:291 start_codon:yes stop_codon:yes gene_type:complete
MAENVQLETTQITLRAHAIASKRSTFIFGTSNRLLLPLVFMTAFTLPNGHYSVFIATLVIFFLEIVLRYMLKMTMKEAIFGITSAAFGSKRKPVRN